MKLTKMVSLVLAVLMVAMCMASCMNVQPDFKNDPPAGTTDEDQPKGTKPVDTTDEADPGDTEPAETTKGNGSEDDQPAGNVNVVPEELKGEYTVTLWASDRDGVAEQFEAQIAAFEQINPGITIKATVEKVSDYESVSRIMADVAAAPDIYCFGQNELTRLVQAAALAAPSQATAAALKANNDASSISAASVDGTLYAYPMTIDNGYFLYYDKSLISEKDVKDMTKIIAACEANNKKFRFDLESGYYAASFFFGAGCHSTWTVDGEGNFTGVDDDFNSQKGMIAMKGMQQLIQSPCYESNSGIFTDAGAVVAGIWSASAAADHFGENLGVVELPSYTVDGQSYHLRSFSDHTLMGVKPQSDAKKTAVLSRLAQYLSGDVCQLERFEEFQWGPSNIEVQATEAIQADISLAALLKQSGTYGVPQGQIYVGWWSTIQALSAAAGTATSDADLRVALEQYKKELDELISTN